MLQYLPEINIVVDKKCNQKCKYCEFAQQRYVNRTDKEIFSYFDSVMNLLEQKYGIGGFRPQLLGGEITMFSKWLTDNICNRLNDYKEVLIYSNGYDRHSRFYTESGYYAITHIIYWYRFNISKFPILHNETLAFCITHDELCRVESLLSTANGTEKILLLPCQSDNPAWNCTPEDKLYLSKLQDKYDGIDSTSVKKRFIQNTECPIIDCTENKWGGMKNEYKTSL